MLSHRNAGQPNAMPGPRVSAFLQDFETTKVILHLETTVYTMMNRLHKGHSINKCFLLDLAKANLLVVELRDLIMATEYRHSRGDYGKKSADDKLQQCNGEFQDFALACKEEYEADHGTLLTLLDSFGAYYSVLVFLMQDNTACFARIMAQGFAPPDWKFCNAPPFDTSKLRVDTIIEYGMLSKKALKKMIIAQQNSKGRQCEMCHDFLDQVACDAEGPVEALYKSANKVYLSSMCKAILKQAAHERHAVWQIIKCTTAVRRFDADRRFDASNGLALIQKALAEIAAHLTECLPGTYYPRFSTAAASASESSSLFSGASTGAADSDFDAADGASQSAADGVSQGAADGASQNAADSDFEMRG